MSVCSLAPQSTLSAGTVMVLVKVSMEREEVVSVLPAWTDGNHLTVDQDKSVSHPNECCILFGEKIE